MVGRAYCVTRRRVDIQFKGGEPRSAPARLAAGRARGARPPRSRRRQIAAPPDHEKMSASSQISVRLIWREGIMSASPRSWGAPAGGRAAAGAA